MALIQALTQSICGSTPCRNKKVEIASTIADGIVGVALLALALLAIFGVLGLPTACAWGLLGAGAAYTLWTLTGVATKVKETLCPSNALTYYGNSSSREQPVG